MKFERGQVIAVANQKGGCGKTTTVVNLGAALAKQGYKTCLVDIDAQCNTTTSFGIDLDELHRAKRHTVLDVYLNKKRADGIAFAIGGEDRFGGLLHIVPGHRSLSAVPHRLEADMKAQSMEDGMSAEDEDDMRGDHRSRLEVSLDSLRGQFDIILIDTPPELGFLLSTALGASDWFIIPVFPSVYDLSGLEQLMANVTKVRKRRNPALRLLGVLLGNFDNNTVLDEQIYQELKGNFGAYLSPVKIRRGVRMREAPAHGLTVFEHDPVGPIADEFSQVATLTADGIRTQLARRASGARIAEPHAMRLTGGVPKDEEALNG